MIRLANIRLCWEWLQASLHTKEISLPILGADILIASSASDGQGVATAIWQKH
jgi:hypothetical protein